MVSAIHKPPWLLPRRFYPFPFHPLIQEKKCCFYLVIQIKEMTQDPASVYFFLAHVDFQQNISMRETNSKISFS